MLELVVFVLLEVVVEVLEFEVLVMGVLLIVDLKVVVKVVLLLIMWVG